MAELKNEAKNSSETESALRIEWQWVIYGTIVGLILVSAVTTASSVLYKNDIIPFLIGALGFVITGMILGHYSPGHTLKESILTGLLISIIAFLLMYFNVTTSSFNEYSFLTKVIIVVLATILTLIGGWVGEELEGYDKPTKFLQWHWIIVASVIGFTLNSFVLFFITMMIFKLIPIIIFMGISFFVSGLIAGYKSPGHTEIECGISGIVTVLLNYSFLKFGLTLSDEILPVSFLIIALIAGSVLALAGGWVGEKIQDKEIKEQKELE
jgi:hypothetical protein